MCERKGIKSCFHGSTAQSYKGKFLCCFLFTCSFSSRWCDSPLKSICVHHVLQSLPLPTVYLCSSSNTTLLCIGTNQQEFLELQGESADKWRISGRILASGRTKITIILSWFIYMRVGTEGGLKKL